MTFMVGLSPKTKRTIRSVLKWGLIVVAVGLVVWFAAVSPYLSSREKQRFEKAAAHLEELASEIQAKVGNADEVSRDKNCGYASAKFTRGARSCGVTIELSYFTQDSEQANSKLGTVSAHIGTPLSPETLRENNLTFKDSDDTEQYLSQDITYNDLNCAAQYTFTGSITSRVSKPERKSQLIISLRCGGPARAEHYPLREY